MYAVYFNEDVSILKWNLINSLCVDADEDVIVRFHSCYTSVSIQFKASICENRQQHMPRHVHNARTFAYDVWIRDQQSTNNQHDWGQKVTHTKMKIMNLDSNWHMSLKLCQPGVPEWWALSSLVQHPFLFDNCRLQCWGSWRIIPEVQ